MKRIGVIILAAFFAISIVQCKSGNKSGQTSANKTTATQGTSPSDYASQISQAAKNLLASSDCTGGNTNLACANAQAIVSNPDAVNSAIQTLTQDPSGLSTITNAFNSTIQTSDNSSSSSNSNDLSSTDTNSTDTISVQTATASKSLSGGAITGIVLGSVIGAVIVGGVAYFGLIKDKAKDVERVSEASRSVQDPLNTLSGEAKKMTGSSNPQTHSQGIQLEVSVTSFGGAFDVSRKHARSSFRRSLGSPSAFASPSPSQGPSYVASTENAASRLHRVASNPEHFESESQRDFLSELGGFDTSSREVVDGVLQDDKFFLEGFGNDIQHRPQGNFVSAMVQNTKSGVAEIERAQHSSDPSYRQNVAGNADVLISLASQAESVMQQPPPMTASEVLGTNQSSRKVTELISQASSVANHMSELVDFSSLPLESSSLLDFAESVQAPNEQELKAKYLSELEILIDLAQKKGKNTLLIYQINEMKKFLNGTTTLSEIEKENVSKFIESVRIDLNSTRYYNAYMRNQIFNNPKNKTPQLRFPEPSGAASKPPLTSSKATVRKIGRGIYLTDDSATQTYLDTLTSVANSIASGH